MKNIMIVVQCAGGVDRYLHMFLKYFDKKKYNVILVCSHDYIEEKYKDLVSELIYVDMQREISLKHDAKAILSVRKIIRKYKPDMIYMHSSKAGALGRIADIGIKNCVIYNPHGWAFCMDCSEIKKVIYRLVECILSHKTDKIIAISECEKTRALNNKICNQNKIEIIYNGIDLEEYDENSVVKKDQIIPQDAYVIGCVARICKNKATDVFVSAAYEIKKKIPEAFFVLVGDGPDRAEIEHQIRQLGLKDSFYITGWVENPFDYIKMFNQGMLLTRWESFGLVIVEYMLAKVPCIGTNVDSLPELIEDGVSGLLVKKDAVDQVAAASWRLYCDKQLCENIINKAYTDVYQYFDVRRTVTQHEVLFDKICK